MKRKVNCILIVVVGLFIPFNISAYEWQAMRITAFDNQNATNSWLNFRKKIMIDEVPNTAVTNIACDSKYWLWVNGNLVIFEGQLKRGPTPKDTYYDEIDLAPFLKRGENLIAILVWYFGKDGFSHKSSGEAALAFECPILSLITDDSWEARMDTAFEHTQTAQPNFRLSESNVRFNSQKGSFEWTKTPDRPPGFQQAKVVGPAEGGAWGRLVKRNIPMWKDYGIRSYQNNAALPTEGDGKWINCELPYNAQVTPILDIEAPKGLTIKMKTDNSDYLGAKKRSVSAEYVTNDGRQQFESLGWMNGHVVKYLIPKGVKIHSLSYRETGFNTGLTGYFQSSDAFYDTLWKKSQRTLYVTMRDNYMDCPDRERAQWWGDLVNQCGQAFYGLGPSSAMLIRKGIEELIGWQKDDGILFSPIPAGNWDRELPGQMLASIGKYGFWNYYLNTGDKHTIAKVYDGVRKYLDIWQLKPDGTLVEREGGWYWGDWGVMVDKQLLFNSWYSLALQGYLNMALLLGDESEAKRTKILIDLFKQAYNQQFWDGKGYRTKDYEGKYDDRAQALAVLAGLADKDKYQQLLSLFKTSFLASPYMEKYVLEALFMMGEDTYALDRMKARFTHMVQSPYSTLYENFGGGADRDGFGTNNHSWSGGALTLLSQYVCGLEPTKPGWESFSVKPRLGRLTSARTGNLTKAGAIEVDIERKESVMLIMIDAPEGSAATVFVPEEFNVVYINDELVYESNRKITDYKVYSGAQDGRMIFSLMDGGKYNVTAVKKQL